uniref:MADS-box domain-containing protein n=2 Tax=Hordeum vulgare subsp. vulgare TaxID=112509 RepID=A0A8I6XKS4_HORVV
MAAKRKGGNGRKKTVLLPIVKKNARHVSFSKRKGGLFSKASMLAELTGAQVAAVVFSPGGNVFSFGHPSVDAVVDRFMAGDGAEVQAAAADHRLQTLYRLHGVMRKELAERNKGKKRADEALAQQHAAGDQIAAWLQPEVHDMGYEDMAAFAATLMQVQAAVSGRSNQVLMEAYHLDIKRKLQVPPPPPPPLQLFSASTFEVGSSSNDNAGIEMQQMQMAMRPPPPPLQLFSASTFELGSSSNANAGIEMQQMQMAMRPPPPQMHQMFMAMQPQPGFAAEQMLPPVPESTAVMEMVHQGFGPNAGYPY